MTSRKKVELDLIPVLVVVAAIELALNRLAVPVLRPPGSVPDWHRDIDLVGLFSFHLATALALGVGLHRTWELFARPVVPPWPKVTRVLVGIGALAFFGLAIWGIFLKPPPILSFHLESCLTLLLLLFSMALAVSGADLRVKLGLVLLTIPFLLHYYGTFALRLLLPGDAARGSSLPDQMRDAGQWAIALSAIGVALCFAPRPLWRSLLRPGPLSAAGFAGTLIAIVMLRHQEVGLELASRGLGIELTPAAPAPIMIAFVCAATAVVWCLASALSSTERSQRLLGMGLALVCIGGYAFAWPLTLLTVVAGALAVVEGGLATAGERRRVPERVRSQPDLPETAWRLYTEALAAEVGGELKDDAGGATVLGKRDGVPFGLKIRRDGTQIEILVGDPPPARPPDWTVASRPDRLLGGRHHPAPPPTSAAHVKTDDEAFDGRFRVHDAGGLTERFLDEGLRARATAVLDGWVAIWRAEGSLCYEVFPGRGAPPDHPLPLTELRAGEPVGPDRMLRVFDLLCAIHRRVA